MAIYRGRYFAASRCTGTKPGVQAFMSWYTGAYRDRNAANLGTAVCKRLGSGWSIHAEGRAADCGTAPYGVPAGWGWDLANALREHSDELGIQLIIFQDRVWSCTQPDAGWRPYSGAFHGHLHTEFTPTAAENLTAARVEEIIGGGDVSILGLSEGDSGPRVGVLQFRLWRAGFPPVPRDLDRSVDDQFGPATAAALLACRKSQGSSATHGRSVDKWAVVQIESALIDARTADVGPGRPTPQQVGTAVEAWMAEHGEQLRGEPGQPGKTPTKVMITGDVIEAE